MDKFLCNLSFRARKAVSALEYAILLGVIAVGVGLAVNVISSDVTTQITKGGDALGDAAAGKGVIGRTAKDPN